MIFKIIGVITTLILGLKYGIILLFKIITFFNHKFCKHKRQGNRSNFNGTYDRYCANCNKVLYTKNTKPLNDI